MIKEIQTYIQKRRHKLLLNINVKNNNDLNKLRKSFNTQIDNSIRQNNLIAINLDNRKSILNFSKQIKDYELRIITYTKFIINFFNNPKNKYTITIFLASGRFKSFDIYKNNKIGGFVYNEGYYNIERNAVVTQNEESFLFYNEDFAAPINFRTLNYIRDDEGTTEEGYEVEISCRNLTQVIDGKAFDGIIKLGKSESPLDWKMLMIGIAILVIGFLQATGKIDLASMLGI